MIKAFSVISLGCFRNTYDSEVFTHRLESLGYKFTPHIPEGKKIKKVNTLVINTCGFIDKAKQESLDIIKEAVDLKKKKKVKKIIVFGCLVKRYKDQLQKSFPEVDQWQALEEFSDKFQQRTKIAPSGIDFLKICEGCLNKCSFCAIPLIKGSLKSKSEDAILKEVRQLNKARVKELNIVGQDITSWGKDLRPKTKLSNLLKKILKAANNINWLRLIYTHPKHLDEDLIRLVAKEEKICKYIDLPIQHINDRILKLMNRRVSKKEIINLINKVRKSIPGVVIRTSVIVGFPTESEKEFRELLDFLKEVKFERLGAFTYSREEGTPAYKLSGQVHPSTKERRLREVMNQQQEIAREVSARFIGEELDVLIEDSQEGTYIGRSQYDAPEVDGEVFIKRAGLKVGQFCKARIIDSFGYDLIGK